MSTSPPELLIPDSVRGNASSDAGYSSFREDEEEEEEEEEEEMIRFGNYELQRNEENRLGTGAFGDVFRGRDLGSGLEVAIKQIPTHQIKPNELKLLQSFRSDFLVNCIGYHDAPNFSFLVLELCDTDLSQHLSRILSRNQLPVPKDLDEFTSSPPEVIRDQRGIQMRLRNLNTVLDNLARGYELLFREKIVHRDLKPQNILLQYVAEGGDPPLIRSAKITDFGISRILASENKDVEGLSNVAGTLLYMAPEVGANLLTLQEYDSQCDLWSLGCVLYQCLTGETPFDERSLCKLFLSAAGANYAAYKFPVVPKETPKPLEALLSSLLEIDRKKRLTPPEFTKLAIQATKLPKDE